MSGMNLTVNSRACTLADGSKISNLLASQKLDPAVVVVEVNKVIIAKEKYLTTALHDNDTVEILRFVGGG
jgi:thiamine biosynthesis protein ThiS